MSSEYGRRPSFRRTASMSLIGVDDVEQATPPGCGPPVIESLAVFSPRIFDAKSSGDPQIQTAHFLKSCGLCHRSLAPDIDVYMYRGDVAFCSVECREQRMKQDERKDRKERRAAQNIGGGHRHEVASAASEKAKTAVAA